MKSTNPYAAIHHWSFFKNQLALEKRIMGLIKKARKQLTSSAPSGRDVYKMICIDASFEALDETMMVPIARNMLSKDNYKDISAIAFIRDSVIPENHTLPLKLQIIPNNKCNNDIRDIDWIKQIMTHESTDSLARSSLFLISHKIAGDSVLLEFEPGSKLVINRTYEYDSITTPCGGSKEDDIRGFGVKGFLHRFKGRRVA